MIKQAPSRAKATYWICCSNLHAKKIVIRLLFPLSRLLIFFLSILKFICDAVLIVERKIIKIKRLKILLAKNETSVKRRWNATALLAKCFWCSIKLDELICKPNNFKSFPIFDVRFIIKRARIVYYHEAMPYQLGGCSKILNELLTPKLKVEFLNKQRDEFIILRSRLTIFQVSEKVEINIENWILFLWNLRFD